jgi:hypothetical protein
VKVSLPSTGLPAASKKNGSSEKFLSGVMKAIEFENEVTLVTQPIGLSQERLDLVIDAFHSAIADPLLPPRQNTAFVTEESLGQLHHLADSRLGGEVAPLVEEGVHLSVRGLLPSNPSASLSRYVRRL